MQPTNYHDCTDQTIAQAAAYAAKQRAKPYVFMLPMSCNHMTTWVVEDRYRTGEELDTAVGAFASEFRSENDGFAPESGKDFLAVMIQNYTV